MADSDRDARVRDRFGLVLLLLVASFVVSAFLSGKLPRILPLLVYLVALTLAVRGAHPVPRWLRRLLWAVAAGSAVAILATASEHRVVRGLVSLWAGAVVGLAIVAVVRRMLAHRVVTLQTIFGALSAYLLIGFLFTAIFAAIANFQREPLFTDGRPANSGTIQYFSFTTMTTIGFGDFTAAGEPARTFAVLDALTGQIFLVTLVARLVSMFGRERGSRREMS